MAVPVAELKAELTKLKRQVNELKKCCKMLEAYLHKGYTDPVTHVPVQSLDSWTKQVTGAMRLVDFVCLAQKTGCGGSGGNIPQDPPTWPPA